MADLNRNLEELPIGAVVVLGVPFDRKSTFRRGPALAPSRIREAFYSDSTHLCAENGLDLASDQRWRDVGDLDLPVGEDAFPKIESLIKQFLDNDLRVICLGGDHSITYPILRAYGRKYPLLNVLQLDAHPDLYDELDGDRFSHASPFARAMEEGLAGRLVQIGIRAMTPHLLQQAERFRVQVFEMSRWQTDALPRFEGPLYLSLDLDVLDPAFAPGVSHHSPGGMTTRQVLEVIQGMRGWIVGADIVEYNPDRDWMGMTGMVGAKFLKEILARILMGAQG